MPRDYAKTPRPKHPNSIPGWAWMLAGLSIGLFVALLVYINDFTASSNKSAVKDAFSSIVNTTSDNVKELKKKSAAIADKEDDNKSSTSKPRFDFYTILPELEVTVPDEELNSTPSTQQASKPTAPLMLQAGSFRRYEAADKLKATLALQGISARIQTITKNDHDKWHRVQVGPIRDLNILNQTRHRLRKMGIASIVVKPKS